MNEVKKSLDAVSGFTSGDLDDVKQGVLSGKRRQKKRNPLPAVITAFVAAAVLFFAFNVLQNDFSTADDDYEVNELIYDYMLRSESNDKEAEPTDEMRQNVLQSMLQIDALIDYAKTTGYSEDMEAIDQAVAKQRDTFYADMDKEGEERKKSILKVQEETFGITYDEYFNVLLKWTFRAEAANNWLVQHPQEEPVTRGEVLGLFENKYERAIADFMKHKSIPLFDLHMKYDDLEGTVAAIEGDQVLVTHGFVEDAPSKKDKLIVNGAASRFVIDDAKERISLGMEIRIVYDALTSPITLNGKPSFYENVIEWQNLAYRAEQDFTAFNPSGLSEEDIGMAYELCVSLLNDYYRAVWNGTEIDLDVFIKNENLKQYIEKKVQSQHAKYGHLNSKVKDIQMNGSWDAELTDDADGGYLYLSLPVAINKYQGGYREGAEFLVRNVDGKLVIVDWYTGGKDTYDYMVRGDNVTVDDPEIWNDDEWVKTLMSKTD